MTYFIVEVSVFGGYQYFPYLSNLRFRLLLSLWKLLDRWEQNWFPVHDNFHGKIFHLGSISLLPWHLFLPLSLSLSLFSFFFLFFFLSKDGTMHMPLRLLQMLPLGKDLLYSCPQVPLLFSPVPKDGRQRASREREGSDDGNTPFFLLLQVERRGVKIKHCRRRLLFSGRILYILAPRSSASRSPVSKEGRQRASKGREGTDGGITPLLLI